MKKRLIFTAKTLYRWVAHGRPKVRVRGFIAQSVMVEERVVLIRASSSVAATKKAEQEARAYSKSDSYFNPVGQRVTTEYLGLCDIYEIPVGIADKTELFSTTDVVIGNPSRRALLRSRLGSEDRLADRKRRLLRLKFLNRDLSQTEPYLRGAYDRPRRVRANGKRKAT